MSDPIITHIIHAKAERVTAVRGAEVHVTVGVHGDRRITLAFTPELAAALAPAIADAARGRTIGRARKALTQAKAPVLKPSGGLL